MARGDRGWVKDILSAIADIRADTEGMNFTAFAAKPATVMLYSIAVIGEAAKNISPASKAVHQDIPWRAIAGIRDRIVHEYFRTNSRPIWDVVADDIDALEEALRKPTDRPPPP